MHELITRIAEKAGISTDQATQALETVKNFVKEKFPMMAGAVDNLFVPDPEDEVGVDAAAATTGVTTAVPDPAAPIVPEPTMLDKISDLIPGETGQKVEDFVKGAAHKAGDVYEDVKEKLGGMFGGDKK
jgi:hypothetical protein